MGNEYLFLRIVFCLFGCSCFRAFSLYSFCEDSGLTCSSPLLDTPQRMLLGMNGSEKKYILMLMGTNGSEKQYIQQRNVKRKHLCMYVCINFSFFISCFFYGWWISWYLIQYHLDIPVFVTVVLIFIYDTFGPENESVFLGDF